jgi:hypothetical protein
MPLAGFVVAVVVAGNAAFGAGWRTAEERRPEESQSEYVRHTVARVKRKVERARRVIEETLLPGNGRLVEGEFTVNGDNDEPKPPKGLKRLVEPDPARYLHPLDDELGTPTAPPVRLEPAMPARFEMEMPSPRAVLGGWFRPRSSSFLLDLGNDLFNVPEAAMDSLFDAGRGLFPNAPSVSLRQQAEQGGTMSRVFTFHDPGDIREPFTDALTRWVAREQQYFAGFADSPLMTFDVEDGSVDVDKSEMMFDQRRILMDVGRKLYLGKYVVRLEDRVRDDAYKFSDWRGVDFLLGPPVIAVYTYIRGFDKRINLGGDVQLRMHLDPIRRIREFADEEERDLVGALSFELGVKGFPLKAILTFGLHNGDPEMDFVGIGTSVGEARKVVAMVLGIEEPLNGRR